METQNMDTPKMDSPNMEAPKMDAPDPSPKKGKKLGGLIVALVMVSVIAALAVWGSQSEWYQGMSTKFGKFVKGGKDAIQVTDVKGDPNLELITRYADLTKKDFTKVENKMALEKSLQEVNTNAKSATYAKNLAENDLYLLGIAQNYPEVAAKINSEIAKRSLTTEAFTTASQKKQVNLMYLKDAEALASQYGLPIEVSGNANKKLKMLYSATTVTPLLVKEAQVFVPNTIQQEDLKVVAINGENIQMDLTPYLTVNNGLVTVNTSSVTTGIKAIFAYANITTDNRILDSKLIRVIDNKGELAFFEAPQIPVESANKPDCWACINCCMPNPTMLNNEAALGEGVSNIGTTTTTTTGLETGVFGQEAGVAAAETMAN